MERTKFGSRKDQSYSTISNIIRFWTGQYASQAGVSCSQGSQVNLGHTGSTPDSKKDSSESTISKETISSKDQTDAIQLKVEREVEDLMANGKWRDAEALQAEMTETRKLVYGSDDLGTLSMTGKLAVMIWHQGLFSEAEHLQRDILEKLQRFLGPDDHEVLMAKKQLGIDKPRP